jgi:hypothetical protein
MVILTLAILPWRSKIRFRIGNPDWSIGLGAWQNDNPHRHVEKAATMGLPNFVLFMLNGDIVVGGFTPQLKIELAGHEIVLSSGSAIFLPEFQALVAGVQADALGQLGLFSGADSLDLYVRLEELVGQYGATMIVLLVVGDPNWIPEPVIDLVTDLRVCAEPQFADSGWTPNVQRLRLGQLDLSIKPQEGSRGSIYPAGFYEEPGGQAAFGLMATQLALPYLVGANDRVADGQEDMKLVGIATIRTAVGSLY